MGTNSTTKFLKYNAGRFTEVYALTTSAGAADANRLVALNAAGVLDDTILNASATSSANKIPKMNASGVLEDAILGASATSSANKVAKMNASGVLDDGIIGASVTASANKIPKLNGSGILDDSVMNATATSTGVGSAAKVVKLNGSGILDDSVMNASVTGVANKIVKLNASGKLDASVIPTGFGDDASAIVCSEALVAGDFVNVYSNAGTINVRKANAATGLEASGFVLSAFASGATATVYWEGVNTACAGLTVGTNYLSTTTAGKSQVAAPTTAGQICQFLGVALSATSLEFEASVVFEIA